MKREEVRVAVVRMEGTNCEEETARSFREMGACTDILHLKQLEGTADPRAHLEDYHILFFPGGFSAGDYIRAGSIFASRLLSRLEKNLRRFIEEGRLVAGVCNGFQVLTEIGALPGIGDTLGEKECALTTNEKARFECRPTFMKVVSNKTPALSLYQPGEVVQFPSAHQEGRLVFRTEEIEEAVLSGGLSPLRYSSPDGEEAGYPANPNGSPHGMASLTNPTGNVLGLMPHPERNFYPWHYRLRSAKGELRGGGDGKRFFEGMVKEAARKF